MKTSLRLTSASLIAVLFFSFATDIIAQDNVGIGTVTPQENAILDIESTDKGLLVPRLNSLQRLAIAPVAAADGLLVYDTDSSTFCYWNQNITDWVCLDMAGGFGTTGPQEPAGSAGPAGGVGPAGADGATGTAGPTGAAGADGAIGPQGPTGPVTGVTGPTGANGADGTTGPAGADGTTGPAGADGADGTTGPAGANGTNGTTGPAGPAGAPGTQGLPGTPGPAGATGAAGPAGPTGPAGSSNFSSVSLSSIVNVASAAYSNVAGMSLTFTATGTQAYISFTASGYGYPNSMSYVSFQVLNGATSVAKTNTKIQNYDDVEGTITPWSCASSRLLTGLTIGNSYTLSVQGLVGGILGTYTAVIDPSLNGHHICLTVLQ